MQDTNIDIILTVIVYWLPKDLETALKIVYKNPHASGPPPEKKSILIDLKWGMGIDFF